MIDPPSRLPVDHLSLSSMRLLMQCPERWRRRYLERTYEPPSGRMILGSAAGAAENQHFGRIIEGNEGLTTDEVLDEFSSEWDDRTEREEVDWGSDKPGELKDSGVRVLDRYHTLVAPQVHPVSIERKFELRWDGLEWCVVGYLDLEDASGVVGDFKVKGRRMSAADANADLQPDMYLAARRAEGNPATGFQFHTMVHGNKLPIAEVVPTMRTDRQLDALTDRIFAVAAELAWRTETDTWIGAAPGLFRSASDVCSRCGYTDCKFRLG